MNCSRRTFLRTAVAGGVGVALGRTASAEPIELDDAAKRQLEAILADKAIWGKGFGKVLTNLPTLAAGGSDKVLVFPDQVVGATAYKTAADAEAAQAKFLKVKLVKKYAPLAVIGAAHDITDPAAPGLKPQVLKAFPDDGSVRLGWKEGETKFLAAGLTIAAVRKQHGKAAKVQTVAVSSDRDSRPLILTYHEYANGAVAFVESDASPTPGAVDRVVLATAPSVGVIFGEKP